VSAIVEIEELRKSFMRRRGLRREVVQAVRGISFAVARGETLGIVGESGCGKSTLGRCIAGILPLSGGTVSIEGRPVGGRGGWPRVELARKVQMVFQDPYASLNPRLPVGAAIGEVVHVHRLRPRDRIATRVAELLDIVGLPAAAARRLPHEFSGGQRQRISIARALAAEPGVIIADEPVSALDVSIQAQILNLFGELRARLGLTYLFVSHDLHVVRHVSDRVAVLYLGELVEMAPVDTLFSAPRHPYTRALLSAVPQPDPTLRSTATVLEGELPDPSSVPQGCCFRARCPLAQPRCAAEEPALRPVGAGQLVRCHFS
jgi:oligopeptide/dipeptide ABC transporter ATP-binding protein